MMHENILIRMQGASLYYRRVISTQNMSVDGGYDIRILLGRRGAALARISVAWLGRVYPIFAESPYSRGKGRGSDVSTPIGPTNASKSLQKDIASGLLILNSFVQKLSFSS